MLRVFLGILIGFLGLVLTAGYFQHAPVNDSIQNECKLVDIEGIPCVVCISNQTHRHQPPQAICDWSKQ